ncbi:MAG: hypothetical protein O2856_12125 [Planctomycetota bacterium]|nr:hypothetical protein [Planctomycetota bacterium]
MLTFPASRSLASVVAVASAIALWLNLSPPTSTLNNTPFSKVFSELRSVSAMQLVERFAWKSGSKRMGPPLAKMQLVAMNVAMACRI